MARIRTIKPEFFTSLTVANLSHQARLTFVGLWTHVDDRGRCVDDARLVKAALWPLDDRTSKDVDVDLWEIADAGLIQRYTVDGKKFIAVTTWEEHQRISRPSGSKHPAPEEGEATPKAPRILTEPSLNPHGGLSEGSHTAHSDPDEGSFNPPSAPEMPESAEEASAPPDDSPTADVLHLFTSENTDSANPHGGLTEDSAQTPHRKGTGNREQGKDLYSASAPSSPHGEGHTEPSPASKGYDDPRFQTFWARYPKKTSKKKACAAFTKALKRTTFENLMAGLEHYLTSDQRVLDGYVKDPTTWLNGDCWEDEPVRAAAAAGGHAQPAHTGIRNEWMNRR